MLLTLYNNQILSLMREERPITYNFLFGSKS